MNSPREEAFLTVRPAAMALAVTAALLTARAADLTAPPPPVEDTHVLDPVDAAVLATHLAHLTTTR